MNKEVIKLNMEMAKAYRVIDSFVDDYCKEDKDKIEFYKALNVIIENNIELESLSNQ